MATDASAVAVEDWLAVALPLVLITVPLPTDSKRALRQVCRATNLMIDEDIVELNLELRSMDDRRSVSTPLTSGLTALRFRAGYKEYSAVRLESACKMAINNCLNLELLEFAVDFLDLCYSHHGDTQKVQMLSMLSSCDWPQLSSLSLFGFPSIFYSHIKVECMPLLTELRVHGTLDPKDIAVLCGSERFTSTITVLEVHSVYNRIKGGWADECLKNLLMATSKLRHLALGILGCRDLGFLAAAELPSLESLYLFKLYKEPLEPIVSIARPSLRTLTLKVGDGKLDLLPLISSEGARSLSHLENLVLEEVDITESDFMADMRLTTLKSLTFAYCNMALDDVARLGVGLANLPQLETLELKQICDARVEGLMRALLSGTPHPRLRRLVIQGDDWMNSLESLKVLIEFGHIVPHLEDIVMLSAIEQEGFVALAAAGRQGLWPNLKLVQMGLLHNSLVSKKSKEAVTEFCRDALLQVWPDVAVMTWDDFRW